MAMNDETAAGDTPADAPRSAAAARRAARSQVGEREVQSGSRGLIQFLRECVAELRRVAWPDRAHLWQATLVVIVAVVDRRYLPVCARLGVQAARRLDRREAGVLSAPRFR